MEASSRDRGLLPWAEIAKILDLPVSTVRANYEAAIKRVRTAMLKSGVSEQELADYLRARLDEE